MNFFKDKKRFNKKGITWEQLVMAIIAVVVVVLVIMWFKGGGEDLFGFMRERTSALQDRDGDKVADMLDKCPCDPSIGEKFPEGITACGVSCPPS